MANFKDIQIDLLESIERFIEAFYRRSNTTPTKDEITDELTRYYTFDEIYICLDGINDFIELLGGVKHGTN
jgi:hypothetical protein